MLRGLFGTLRALRPVGPLFGATFVTRHADVVDVLRRQSEFSVEGIYADKMKATSGEFFLGMDEGDRYHAEADRLRAALRAPDDFAWIREIARGHSEAIVAEALARGGDMDVVEELTREVPIRVVAEFFGVPGPDNPTMRRWMRDIFNHLFFNLDDDARQRKDAEVAAAELGPYLFELIAERRGAGGRSVIDRLAADPELDDDFIKRNIGGLIIGAVDTTSKAAVHALGVLLCKDQALEGARCAALADNHPRLLAHVFEALRFDPFNPVMQRSVPRDAYVGVGGKRAPAGKNVWVSPLSAMFDARAFESPRRFSAERPLASYLHFGFGLHECYGSQINRVTLPEILRPILRVWRVRGHRRDIDWDHTGQFPDHWQLQLELRP